MSITLSPPDRKALAATARINEAYLWQCLTARREMGATEAVRVEQATSGKLRRWHLCQRTWHRIWPELIGAEGAPEVAAEAKAA